MGSSRSLNYNKESSRPSDFCDASNRPPNIIMNVQDTSRPSITVTCTCSHDIEYGSKSLGSNTVLTNDQPDGNSTGSCHGLHYTVKICDGARPKTYRVYRNHSSNMLRGSFRNFDNSSTKNELGIHEWNDLESNSNILNHGRRKSDRVSSNRDISDLADDSILDDPDFKLDSGELDLDLFEFNQFQFDAMNYDNGFYWRLIPSTLPRRTSFRSIRERRLRDYEDNDGSNRFFGLGEEALLLDVDERDHGHVRMMIEMVEFNSQNVEYVGGGQKAQIADTRREHARSRHAIMIRNGSFGSDGGVGFVNCYCKGNCLCFTLDRSCDDLLNFSKGSKTSVQNASIDRTENPCSAKSEGSLQTENRITDLEQKDLYTSYKRNTPTRKHRGSSKRRKRDNSENGKHCTSKSEKRGLSETRIRKCKTGKNGRSFSTKDDPPNDRNHQSSRGKKSNSASPRNRDTSNENCNPSKRRKSDSSSYRKRNASDEVKCNPSKISKYVSPSPPKPDSSKTKEHNSFTRDNPSVRRPNSPMVHASILSQQAHDPFVSSDPYASLSLQYLKQYNGKDCRETRDVEEEIQCVQTNEDIGEVPSVHVSDSEDIKFVGNDDEDEDERVARHIKRLRSMDVDALLQYFDLEDSDNNSELEEQAVNVENVFTDSGVECYGSDWHCEDADVEEVDDVGSVIVVPVDGRAFEREEGIDNIAVDNNMCNEGCDNCAENNNGDISGRVETGDVDSKTQEENSDVSDENDKCAEDCTERYVTYTVEYGGSNYNDIVENGVTYEWPILGFNCDFVTMEYECSSDDGNERDGESSSKDTSLWSSFSFENHAYEEVDIGFTDRYVDDSGENNVIIIRCENEENSAYDGDDEEEGSNLCEYDDGDEGSTENIDCKYTAVDQQGNECDQFRKDNNKQKTQNQMERNTADHAQQFLDSTSGDDNNLIFNNANGKSSKQQE